MIIETNFKAITGKVYSHLYTNVVKYSVFPKKDVKNELDKATYDEMPDYIFRLYFTDGEQATWGCSPDFKYKVLSFN